MQSEYSDVLDNERLVQGQLALGWHPTLNVVTIEDEEVHLRRPSEEEVKNLTKAAIAKAKHNYNLRSTKRDTDQGEPGSMFVKEVTKKGASSRVTDIPKASQEKEEQVKDLPKGTDDKKAGDVQRAETVKRASQFKTEKVKVNTKKFNNSAFDMAQALTQKKVTILLIEMLKIKEHKDAALSLFSSISDSDSLLPTGLDTVGKDQEFQTPEVYVRTTITQEPSQVDPFYVTLLVNNQLIKNCMIDSGAAANVMPYGVMKELGLSVTTVYGKCYAMDNREVPIIGTMKDVEVKIAAFPEATYKMDVIVTDTKPHYGMLLSRQWAAAVWGNVQLDLSYATIPIGGNQVKLHREPWAPKVIENVDCLVV